MDIWKRDIPKHLRIYPEWLEKKQQQQCHLAEDLLHKGKTKGDLHSQILPPKTGEHGRSDCIRYASIIFRLLPFLFSIVAVMEMLYILNLLLVLVVVAA
jgi:hypothetical protein